MMTRSARLSTCILLPAVALLFAASGSAQAQTTLKWKFKQGEKFGYVSEQKTVSKGNVMGMEIETNMNQTTDVTWSIKSVDSEGVAEMTQTIDRIRMKMETPFGSLDYDSKDSKNAEGQFGEIMGPILSLMAGAEMTMKMEPNGTVRDVKLPEKLVESLRTNPALAQFGSMFSEDGIKQMTQGGAGSLGAFPKGGVSKGQTWDKKAEMKNPFGNIVVSTVSTYVGPDTRNGAKVEKIDLKMTQTIEPAPGGMFEIKITSQDSSGSAYFDNSVGRLVAQELKQKMKMEIEFMGNVIEQDAETVMSIKLSDAKKSN
jgi:hypothetical protein